MSRARLARAALAATVEAVWRRALRGPLRPSWSFRFEVAVGGLRRYARWATAQPLPVLREAWEAVATPALPGVVREIAPLEGVRAEWFVPPAVRRAQAPDEGPVVLYLHGGAYVWGSIASYAELLSRLAIAARARVLAIEYRLAPEHPCPAAHDDALAAYRWLLEHGVGAGRVVVAGDSAGGNLTLELALRLLREGLPSPRGLALLCPWVDLDREGGSLEAHATTDWMTADQVRPWIARYYPQGSPRDPLASPLYADLRGLPPTLVQVGTAELLLDQVRDLGVALAAAGVPHQLTEYADMVHDWHVLAGMFPGCGQAIGEVGRFVRDPAAVVGLATRG